MKIGLKNVAVVGVLSIGLMFSSCKKDEAQLEPQVGLEFKTMTSAISLKSTQTAAVGFTSGFITLSEVQFEVESENDSLEVEFELDINTKIDFATGQTNPDISHVEIPAGTYDEVEIEIELQDEGDTPAIVLNGTFTDTLGVSHSLRFEFYSGETFEVEKEGKITFNTNQSVLAQIKLDPAVWFSEVENEQLANATKDADGVIVISATQNVDIFDVVSDGLDLATEVEIIL